MALVRLESDALITGRRTFFSEGRGSGAVYAAVAFCINSDRPPGPVHQNVRQFSA